VSSSLTAVAFQQVEDPGHVDDADEISLAERGARQQSAIAALGRIGQITDPAHLVDREAGLAPGVLRDQQAGGRPGGDDSEHWRQICYGQDGAAYVLNAQQLPARSGNGGDLA
jgi:hypothetical protein